MKKRVISEAEQAKKLIKQKRIQILSSFRIFAAVLNRTDLSVFSFHR